MIRYDLTCARGHEFDAWFSDSASFEEQQEKGLVACPVCGDTRVRRQLARPGIPMKGNRRPSSSVPSERPASTPTAPATRGAEGQLPLSEGEARVLRQFVRELHAFVREKAEYVGSRFPEEARRRHEAGKAGERPIWGEATAEEARSLREEGIEVLPLPPLPDKKN
jgi:hypothetical protein